MKPNVGGRDRTARIVLGTLLPMAAVGTALGLVPVPGAVRLPITVVDFLLGDALLLSALLRRSLLNHGLGIDTTTDTLAGDEEVPA